VLHFVLSFEKIEMDSMMASEFEKNLAKYADVAVHIGLNLHKGQRLFIYSPIEARSLAHAISRSAYKAGAKYVHVQYIDPILDKIRVEDGAEETLDEYTAWLSDGVAQHMDNGDAILSISAADPDLMAGQDPKRMKRLQRTVAMAGQSRSERIMRNKTNWLIVMAPHPALSAKIFPKLSPAEAEKAHWETIFKMCRVDQADPVKAWEQHAELLEKRAETLNKKQYHALHYVAPGTDLTIGLPENHVWRGAGQDMDNGTHPIVNIPTEEVFTLAHKDRIDGVVRSTKPLPFNGTIIENFTLQFSEGSVVSATAEKGQDALDILLGTDEGARSIGEVALVPHSSPISQSGLLFYNILYDENASNHLALGRAYRFSLEGGTTMSDEEFESHGGNNSLIHVDFMMGSGEMDVDGITADGKREPVLRKGEWAF
jgi:aminopeptidase